MLDFLHKPLKLFHYFFVCISCIMSQTLCLPHSVVFHLLLRSGNSENTAFVVLDFFFS